jgi:hypothetical protein
MNWRSRWLGTIDNGGSLKEEAGGRDAAGSPLATAALRTTGSVAL